MISFKELFAINKLPKITVKFKSLFENNNNFERPKPLIGNYGEDTTCVFSGAVHFLNKDECIIYISRELSNDAANKDLDNYIESWEKMIEAPVIDSETSEGERLIEEISETGSFPIIEANGGGIKHYVYKISNVGVVICLIGINNVHINNDRIIVS